MSPLQRILCAIDVTEPSSQVLQTAVGLARVYGAELLLVYVFNPPLALRVALPQYAGGMLDSGARTELQAELDLLAEPVRKAGVRVRTTVSEGRPAAELVRVARQRHADMIAMGTHGRSGVGRLVLGSVAEETIRSAACPVLTIPVDSVDPQEAGPSDVAFRNILCAVDFSPESLAGLKTAIALAAHVQGTVRVLHVVEDHEWWRQRFKNLPEYEQRVLEEARARLASVVPKDAGCEVKVLDVVVAPRPYIAVLREAEAQPTDLIALGVRGRGAVDMMLTGSTTNRVLREARCPVLTTRDIASGEGAAAKD